jgi:hypothetical protein
MVLTKELRSCSLISIGCDISADVRFMRAREALKWLGSSTPQREEGRPGAARCDMEIDMLIGSAAERLGASSGGFTGQREALADCGRFGAMPCQFALSFAVRHGDRAGKKEMSVRCHLEQPTRNTCARGRPKVLVAASMKAAQ